jgi:hypothetical protein
MNAADLHSPLASRSSKTLRYRVHSENDDDGEHAKRDPLTRAVDIQAAGHFHFIHTSNNTAEGINSPFM